MSGAPRRAAETAKPLMKVSAEAGRLDEPRRERVEAAGHDVEARAGEERPQARRRPRDRGRVHGASLPVRYIPGRAARTAT